MTAAEVIAVARQWVRDEAVKLPGYCGAYLSGSALERQPGEIWPEDSDVDVVLLFDGALPGKIGKFRHDGVLMEITVLPMSELADPETVLRTHYLAFALNGGRILHDPTGRLAPLCGQVQAEFWKIGWLNARIGSTAAIAQRHISGIAAATAPEGRLMSCGFGPSAIALPLLAAAGQNCTVRKRIPKAKNVLRQYGFAEFCAKLDDVMGCADMPAAAWQMHMDALERTYCRAMTTEGSSRDYPFRSDIRPDAMAAAIGGTRALLQGEPKDAVFWMMATFARCMTVLRMDDMQAYEECLPDMQAFAAALGVADAGSAQKRQALAQRTLDEAVQIAKQIAARAAK